MKKLIFTVTTDLTYDQRMQRICASLAHHGYDVLLVGRFLPSSASLRQKNFRQHRLTCTFNKGKLFYLEFMLRLWWFLRRTNADAYCAIDLDTALPVYLTAKSKNKPFGYDAHEYFPEVIELQNRPAAKKIWQKVEQFIIPRTQFAYTVTNTIANKFKELYGKQFDVIRNATVLKNKPLPNQKPERYFIYQGAVNEGRGLEQTLEAMQFVNAKLLICGSGDVLQGLKNRASELNLQAKVEFAGYVLPEKLQQLTEGAWAGLNLLENRGLSYYFSLANKFFDYVHAEIPQICAGFPEYQSLNAEHEVAILANCDAKQIAAAMNKLLNDGDFYQLLAGNCKTAKQTWNWQQEEIKLIELYHHIAPLTS